MPTSIEKIALGFLSTNSRKGKSLTFRYKNGLLTMGRCFVAEKYKDLLFINETVNANNVNLLKKLLIEHSESNGYTVIPIPYDIGEEKRLNLVEIRAKLENRLNYYVKYPCELLKCETRGQYKAHYEQFIKFMSIAFNNEINEQYTTLYKALDDEKFIRQLKFKVAKRKANFK